MKVRLISLLTLVLVAAMLVPAGMHAQGLPPVVNVSEKDVNSLINLDSNTILALNLQANPSTGYSWQVKSMDQKVLRQAGESEFKSDSKLMGAPATQIMHFQGVGAGQTTIELVYSRPWAKDERPSKTFAIQVRSKGAYAGAWKPAVAPAPAAEVTSNTPNVLPTAFNWCTNTPNGCTPIKDQGSCGSCWSFGTVGPLESAIKLADGVTRDLAEQYLVNCNNEGWGCGGGWWAHDYHLNTYVAGEPGAGAVYEADVPYRAVDGACNPPHTHHEKIASWAFVGNESSVPTTAAIKQAIYDHGPVAAAVYVGTAFQNYTPGTVFQTNESGTINHAIVLVGWNDASPGYWILRNSWGTGWGNSGYMNIKYGISQVGYSANYVTYSGGTPGPTATPTTPPPGDEKIVNGGFETGSITPWVQYSSGGYDLIDNTRPHTGLYNVWMGGYNSANEYLYQTITIPTNGTLKYWYYMTSQEGTTTAYDYMRVRLYTSSGTLITTLRTLSNTSTRGAWVQDSISLASYAGQTVRVYFGVTTDSSLTTSFYLDDVSVK